MVTAELNSPRFGALLLEDYGLRVRTPGKVGPGREMEMATGEDGAAPCGTLPINQPLSPLFLSLPPPAPHFVTKEREQRHSPALVPPRSLGHVCVSVCLSQSCRNPATASSCPKM